MTDGPHPAAAGSFLGGLLSEEEVQELLAPLDVGGEEAPEPVLLVANLSSDAERVIMHLMKRNVPVVPAENMHEALELMQRHHYIGLLAAMEALEADLPSAIAALRAPRPEMPLGIITEPGTEWADTSAAAIPRPELEVGIDRFLARVVNAASGRPEPVAPHEGPEPEAADDQEGDEQVPNTERRTRPRLVTITGEPSVDGAEGSAGVTGRAERSPVRWKTSGPHDDARAGADRGPDPLLAVQALLEAKAAGEGLATGLRRWAERDPAILGVAECQLDEAEWRLRATTPLIGERHRMLLLLLDHLGEPATVPDSPVTAGPFSLFPLFRSGRSCVALWHQDALLGRDLLMRLRPLLPLIEALPDTTGDEPAAAVRERFIALLESRMSAIDRGEGQLGVLLVEAPPGESPALLCRDLKAMLRGGDWIDVVGSRLYVILDQPGKGTLSAIGARLREFPSIEQLRVVALGWDPGQGRAAALVGRAERLLAEGGQGVISP